MLDSAKKKGFVESKVVTIIGSGTTITGDVKSKGAIRVEGVIAGRVLSDDTVLVQESGRVKGEIAANQVVIAGQVEGNVFAQERLEVASKARLLGDIAAPRVSMAEGVLFEGKCTMKAANEMSYPAWQSELTGQDKAAKPGPAPAPAPAPSPTPKQTTLMPPGSSS